MYLTAIGECGVVVAVTVRAAILGRSVGDAVVELFLIAISGYSVTVAVTVWAAIF